MSSKPYRFILEKVFGKYAGRLAGPYSADGRMIVALPEEIEMVGGVEEGVCVDEVKSGTFKIHEHFAKLPSIIKNSSGLVVSEEVKSILNRFQLADGIGSLPMELVGNDVVISGYHWIYAKKWLQVPCDVPKADLVLLSSVDWMITDELRQALVAAKATGVAYNKIGK